jgi:6-phosphogluconolactonase
MQSSWQGIISVRGEAPGVYRIRLDGASGRLDVGERVVALAGAGAFDQSADGTRLYVATQVTPEDPGSEMARGRLHAYRLTPQGDAEGLSVVETHGTTPCYVTVLPQGRGVVVANFRRYGSRSGPGAGSRGSLAVAPLQEDGSLGGDVQVITHAGSSAHPTRQTHSHPHAAVVDPSGRWVVVADLGTDRVYVYPIDAVGRRLDEGAARELAFPPLHGPRHLMFGPTGERVYIIHEIANAITTCAFDPEGGTLDPIETVSTLPEEYAGDNACADVWVAPSGRTLYASNRGHNSLVVFEIGTDGGLTPVQWLQHPGLHPADFCLTPDGGHLLAPSGTQLWSLAADAKGRLSGVGEPADAPGPVTWVGVGQDR